MQGEDTRDVADKERELREREEAVKEQDPHERSPEADSGGIAGGNPAPPGPEAQQPRG